MKNTGTGIGFRTENDANEAFSVLGARVATQGEGDVAEHACKEYTNSGGIRRRTA